MDNSYNEFSEKIPLIDYFINLCIDYNTTPRDYNNSGQLMNIVEMHTLLYIDENPGANVTAIAKEFRRTKGAISQTISKLEDKGLIRRKLSVEHKKIINFYATKAGQKLSEAHRAFDEHSYKETYADLRKDCTPEELHAFYKVVEAYIKVLEQGALSRNEK